MVVVTCLVMAFTLGAGLVNAASVGKELSNPQIRDADNNPATFPDFGTHVLAVTYADTSAADFGDPLNDAMKAKKYSKEAYRGVGVANMKDSLVPNFIIRKKVKEKIEKYKSTVLTDPDHLLPTAWSLGDCKGKSVFVLIGKDKKIKYIRYTEKNNPWNNVEINAVLKIVDDLITKK